MRDPAHGGVGYWAHYHRTRGGKRIGGHVFLLHKLDINYEDIIKKEFNIVDYCVKNSDTFSVVSVIQKPYSQFPPVFNCDVRLRPYVENYLFDRKDWLVDFLGCLKHQIMIVCRCCTGSRKELLHMSNLFLPIKNDMPENICFYRNDKVWFATISHEKMAFMFEPTDKDTNFLKENNIGYSSE